LSGDFLAPASYLRLKGNKGKRCAFLVILHTILADAVLSIAKGFQCLVDIRKYLDIRKYQWYFMVL